MAANGTIPPGKGSQAVGNRAIRHNNNIQTMELSADKPPVPIGRLGKPHGLKGEIRLLTDREEYLDFVEEGGFLLIKGLPYRITSLRDIGGVVVALEGLSDRSAVESYRDLAVALPWSRELEALEEEQGLEGWLGFAVYDRTSQQDLGIIREVREMSSQLIAVLYRNGREILIPLHEDLFADLDLTDKRLMMDLPSGLPDLYL